MLGTTKEPASITNPSPRLQVFLAHKYRSLFAEVAEHNLAVIVRRRQGGDWTAPENQYRDAWAELVELRRKRWLRRPARKRRAA